MNARLTIGCALALAAVLGCKDPKTSPSAEQSQPGATETLQNPGGESKVQRETRPDGTVVTTTKDPITGETKTVIEAPQGGKGGTTYTITETSKGGGLGTTTNVCTTQNDCAFPEGTAHAQDEACKDGNCPSFVFRYDGINGQKQELVYKSSQIGVEVVRNRLKGHIHAGDGRYIGEDYSIGYDLESNGMTFTGNIHRDYPQIDGVDAKTANPEPKHLKLKYDAAHCTEGRKESANPKGFFILFSCDGDRDFDGELFVPEKNILPTSAPVR